LDYLFKKKILPKGVKEGLRIKLLEIRRYDPDYDYQKISVDVDSVHL
jgi:hypothetical protein